MRLSQTLITYSLEERKKKYIYRGLVGGGGEKSYHEKIQANMKAQATLSWDLIL